MMNICPLQWQELSQADQAFRLAFGTAANLADPLQMFGDADYMQRWHWETVCKIWIQQDGTEEGIANELVKQGISANRSRF